MWKQFDPLEISFKFCWVFSLTTSEYYTWCPGELHGCSTLTCGNMKYSEPWVSSGCCSACSPDGFSPGFFYHTYVVIIFSWRLEGFSEDIWGPLCEALSSLVLSPANSSCLGQHSFQLCLLNSCRLLCSSWASPFYFSALKL